MKSLFLLFAAMTAFSISARAELTYPYKTIDVNCAGQGQSISAHWDFSVTPFVHSILVNGVEQAPGTMIESDLAGSTTYSKDGIFAITFDKKDENSEKYKSVTSVQGNSIEMDCEVISRWHITKK